MDVLKLINDTFTNFTGQIILACLLYIPILKKRRFFYWRLALVLVLSVIVRWVLEITVLPDIRKILIGWFTPGYFILFALAALALLFLCKVSLKELIFFATVGYAYQHFIYSLGWLFIDLFSLKDIYWATNLILWADMIIVFGGGYYLTYRRIRAGEVDSINSWAMLGIFSLTVLVVDILSMWSMFSFSFSLVYNPMIRAYGLVCSLLLLLLQFGSSAYSRRKKENIVLRKMIAIDKKQSELSEANLDSLNAMCHDFRHELATASEIGDELKRKDYFKNLETKTEIFGSIVATGVKAVDTVLTEKKIVATRRDIQFDIMADGSALSFMEPGDIYSFLGNAIDNAMDAVTPLPVEARLISLRIVRKDNLAVIHLENAYQGDAVINEEDILNNHKAKEGHGYGVKSMQFICDKYHGVLSFSAAKNIFCVSALIPIPAEKKA